MIMITYLYLFGNVHRIVEVAQPLQRRTMQRCMAVCRRLTPLQFVLDAMGEILGL
jgi:hypothetical protein